MELCSGSGAPFALPAPMNWEDGAMMGTISDRDVFDLNQLRPLFGTEGSRSSLVRLLRKAEAMGYDTTIAAPDWETLRRERGPIITRINKEDSWGDYVLLQGVIGEEVILVDGEFCIWRLTHEEFERVWSGWALILHRRVESAGA